MFGNEVDHIHRLAIVNFLGEHHAMILQELSRLSCIVKQQQFYKIGKWETVRSIGDLHDAKCRLSLAIKVFLSETGLQERGAMSDQVKETRIVVFETGLCNIQSELNGTGGTNNGVRDGRENGVHVGVML